METSSPLNTKVTAKKPLPVPTHTPLEVTKQHSKAANGTKAPLPSVKQPGKLLASATKGITTPKAPNPIAKTSFPAHQVVTEKLQMQPLVHSKVIPAHTTTHTKEDGLSDRELTIDEVMIKLTGHHSFITQLEPEDAKRCANAQK